MKLRQHLLIILAVVSIILVLSLVLNYFLFTRGEQFYLQLNELRLDPLGLSYFTNITPANSGSPLVVFFGDSRAANWPSPNDEKFEFLNRGIGSQTTVQVLERFDAHIAPLMPKIIVIQAGINDLKTIPLFPEDRETIVTNCKNNIQQIVDKSLSLGATVILTTIFPIGEVPIERRPFWSDEVGQSINDVNSYIRSLEADKVFILDAYPFLSGTNGKIKPEYGYDLLHLTDAGYIRLNEELVPLLQNLK